MLILTRRATQTLTIGDEITITVLQINGSHVRIGVTAPATVCVLRGEVRAKAGASRSSDSDS